jgi:hypothetical protein
MLEFSWEINTKAPGGWSKAKKTSRKPLSKNRTEKNSPAGVVHVKTSVLVSPGDDKTVIEVLP